MKLPKLNFIIFLLTILISANAMASCLVFGWYFGQFGHGWLNHPEGYGCKGNWNADGKGVSHENSFSIMWDEPVCNTPYYWTGYQPPSSDPNNNEEGFFTSSIQIRHGYSSSVGGPSKPVCQSSSQRHPTIFNMRNHSYCGNTEPTTKVCIDTMGAPYSKKTLYKWMARVYLGLRFEGNKKKFDDFLSTDPNGKLLDQVMKDNEEVIDRNYNNFGGIDLTQKYSLWMNKVVNDPVNIKRYMTDVPGRKLLCARIIKNNANFVGTGENPDDVCDIEGECLKPLQLYKLIKCVLVPVGPPPPLFVPYIVGDLKVYIVPNRASTYTNPVVRISYSDKGERKFHDCTINPTQSSDSCKFNNYEFTISLEGEKVCTILFRVGSGQAINYPLGCQDRGVMPYPTLNSVPPKSGSTEKVNLEIVYPWVSSPNPFATLQPIDSAKYKNLFENRTVLIPNLDYKEDNGSILSVFQVGFERNPVSRFRNLEQSIKKVCRLIFLDLNSHVVEKIEYVDIYDKCESKASLVTNPNINIYSCEVELGQSPVYVKNQGDCIHHSLIANSTPIPGIECKSGDLVTQEGFCPDINSNAFYEQDNNGKKICLRDYPSPKEAYMAPRTDPSTGTKKIVHFFRSDKVLMELDQYGNIDYTKQPFKNLNSFDQGELDYFQQYNEIEMVYKKDDTEIHYRYAPRKFQVGNEETDYVDENSLPFFPTAEESTKQLIYKDIDIEHLCRDTSITSGSHGWKYNLQMPGYYANYDITSDSDAEMTTAVKSSLQPMIGGILTSDLVTSTTLDEEIKQTLLIPTKFTPASPKTHSPIVGIIADSANRTVSASVLTSKIHTSFNYDFESFNFYPDFFDKVITNNKVSYIDGKNLSKQNENLFDTSQCSTIEFEMWSGGSNSHAAQGTPTSIIDFTTASNPSATCNTNSAGQNGGYLKGKFNIRHDTNIRILVGSASGIDTVTPYSEAQGSTTAHNLSNLNESTIWITDLVDGHIKIASTDKTNKDHNCATNPNCQNLNEDQLTKNAIDNQLEIVQKDGTSLMSKLTHYQIGSNSIKSLAIPVSNLNEDTIQIEQYKPVSMSSYCGINSTTGDLFSTLALSYPADINAYLPDTTPTNTKGYNINKSLTRLDSGGSGNFNEIGTYFFTNILGSESSTTNPFGFGINWSARTGGNTNFNKCESRIKTCYNLKSNFTGNHIIHGGNASGTSDNSINFENVLKSNIIDPNVVKNLVTDMNIYCPGLGGCYHSDPNKGIAQPGTHGLVKISCK